MPDDSSSQGNEVEEVVVVMPEETGRRLARQARAPEMVRLVQIRGR